MSFAGSVLAMIISLRNNARPKRKPFEGVKKHQRRVKYKNNELHFNEVPPEELELIKQTIRLEAKKNNRITLFTKLGFGVVTLVILTFVILKLSEVNKKEERRAVLREIEAQRILDEKFWFLINDGYEWIDIGNYHNAKFSFNEASKLKPNDFSAKLATLRAYIFDCIENNVKCKTAERLLTKYLEEYPDNKDVNEVSRLFDYNKK